MQNCYWSEGTTVHRTKQTNDPREYTKTNDLEDTVQQMNQMIQDQRSEATEVRQTESSGEDSIKDAHAGSDEDRTDAFRGKHFRRRETLREKKQQKRMNIICLSASVDAAIPLKSPTASQHSVAKNLGSFNQGSASSHVGQNVDTEHVKFEQFPIRAEDPDILLTVDEAREIRRNFQGQIGVLHREARAQLNKITIEASQDGATVIYL